MSGGADIPAGGGVSGAEIRAADWSAHPLGPPRDWPPALRMALNIMLNSPESMYLLWGPQLFFFFNDAYRPVLGARMPGAMGQPVTTLWSDVWEDVRPAVEQALAGRHSRFEDAPITMLRHGVMEETWWSFSFSPIPDEAGAIPGVLCFTTETTARILADRALRAANDHLAREVEARTAERERLAQLFQQAPVFMALLEGPEHRITLMNPGYQALVGPRPLAGLTVAEALPDAVAQGYLALLDQVYRSGEAYAAEGARYAVQPKPGGPVTERFVDFVFQPMRDAAGAINGIFMTGVDVTERARNLAALRASEERLSALVNATSDIVYVMSPDWRTMRRLSGRATSPAGTPPVESWLDRYIPAKDRPALRETIRQATQRKAPVELEHRMRGPDGRPRWALSRAVPILDSNGEVAEWFGTASDITARREAEQALRRLNDTLEQQVQERTQALREQLDFTRMALGVTGGVGVWSFDHAQGRYFYDAALADLYGLDAAQGRSGLAPAGFLGHIHPEDIPRLQAVIRDVQERPVELELEYRILHPDGRMRWVLSRGCTHFDAEGRPQRRIGVSVDTTRQHHMEEQLRQAQKMEAVGQLTGGLAHDFNNLLTGITGSLEMMRARIRQGRVAELETFIGLAESAATRATAVTHRLLAFSRRQTLDPRPIDANQLVGSMDELIRHTMGPAIDTRILLAPRLWPVRVDPNQLENALLNLCINARDAMPEGGQLRLETANQTLDATVAQPLELPPGDYVVVSVSDSGTGMTPEVIARAFDPFFTTKPLGEGTGLGLSMIYGFARQSGGLARIDSTPGAGSTVSLYLPRHHGRVEEAAGNTAATLAASGAGRTVLLVDDEPTIRALAATTLRECGHMVLEAAEGGAGLALLRSDMPVDLLVTDVGLPGGMNGRQLADAARSLRPGLRVLFITGYAEASVLGDGKLGPGMHLMPKPFAMAALVERVGALLAGDAVEEALPPQTPLAGD